MSEPLTWNVVHETDVGIRLIDAAGALCGTLVGTNGDERIDVAVPVGRVKDGWTGVVMLVDGRSFEVSNGRAGGLRRAYRTVTIDFNGSRWVCRHVTDRRAVITRNDQEIARVHRTWRWWKPGTTPGIPARADYTFTNRSSQLDHLDELMSTGALAPAGRARSVRSATASHRSRRCSPSRCSMGRRGHHGGARVSSPRAGCNALAGSQRARRVATRSPGRNTLARAPERAEAKTRQHPKQGGKPNAPPALGRPPPGPITRARAARAVCPARR